MLGAESHQRMRYRVFREDQEWSIHGKVKVQEELADTSDAYQRLAVGDCLPLSGSLAVRHPHATRRRSSPVDQPLVDLVRIGTERIFPPDQDLAA